MDQQHAFDKTESGGIKATQLAGALFNHKDDKKGHHDVFRFWWSQNVGGELTFPDTSNTRFQSHCEAAAILLVHLEKFISFLEYVKAKKDTQKFNNMENNLYKALHCTPTKTELAVLALYGQSVSHPYMKALRKDPKVNMLDLAPLHKKIGTFIKQIHEDPDFLIGKNATYETGTFDGSPWHSEKVIDTIKALSPTLPLLKTLVSVFFGGAEGTWKRFTSEFAPGGLIDESTAHEKFLAWMPATNDINEGALGAFRVLMRKQPQLTLLHYNALAMFFHNNTEAFVKKKFQHEDFKYLYKMARNSKGEEKKRKEEIIKFAEARIKQKEERKKKRQENALKRAERVASVQLIFNKDEIDKLKSQKLQDYVEAFINAGAPGFEGIKTKTKVGLKREALKKAIDAKEKGTWIPKTVQDGDSDSHSDSGESFAGLDELQNSRESDWESSDDSDELSDID